MALSLTKDQQQVLGAAAIGLVVFGVIYVKFFWLPISQRQGELTDKIAEIEHQISRAEEKASRLNRLQAELASLNQQAVEAEERLPKSKDVPDILVVITRMAADNRITLQSFSPGPSKAQTYFTELSYPMVVKGGYHNIGRFFAAIALEKRIFNVRDVVYPSEGADGEMTISFTLLTYQYKG